ncbi:uncharacterized protein L3040_001008 [Drepanopeziza brunnea f. sp. 'multigermtubi']|uniref:Uncharacterized protein n=1 Tax=Marssonina brunnea f. sp. multigermtubi (strain MB_m1) TaxID=1072389 RepID=K1W618_MARBU|nr:uncharacterized protein MBM_09434 [Drepanopeziza brunnea f. sp. 'multigermtubi' MB_m1]EKD12400.1 hypothetical protein MBM_09434 [Drepanopeziza brunnea f. sp. 'multigermtubi' MB_m1]KAJ5054743.1 hypothetical protein L3040_001008 [Drepanopeziza brunnea f. sp. 'multigermtubi']
MQQESPPESYNLGTLPRRRVRNRGHKDIEPPTERAHPPLDRNSGTLFSSEYTPVFNALLYHEIDSQEPGAELRSRITLQWPGCQTRTSYLTPIKSLAASRSPATFFWTARGTSRSVVKILSAVSSVIENTRDGASQTRVHSKVLNKSYYNAVHDASTDKVQTLS